MLEEPQLNGRIASVINRLTSSAGWQAREELKGVLRGPQTKPDVLITHADGPPIALETEYPPAATLAADCMKSIGRELSPMVANASGTVNTVIAICAMEELHLCATGDDAQRMLEDGHEIEYAVYQGTLKKHTRFPQGGFIRGNVRDLVDFIRPAGEPQDATNAATQAFEQGVEDAASLILGRVRGSNIGESIGKILRQQWPAYPANSLTTSKELKQEKADREAREQTAKMTATMLINALAYQQNLVGLSAEVEIDGHKETCIIKSIGQIRKPTGLHPDDIIAEWDKILSHQLLAHIPHSQTAVADYSAHDGYEVASLNDRHR